MKNIIISLLVINFTIPLIAVDKNYLLTDSLKKLTWNLKNYKQKLNASKNQSKTLKPIVANLIEEINSNAKLIKKSLDAINKSTDPFEWDKEWKVIHNSIPLIKNATDTLKRYFKTNDSKYNKDLATGSNIDDTFKSLIMVRDSKKLHTDDRKVIIDTLTFLQTSLARK